LRKQDIEYSSYLLCVITLRCVLHCVVYYASLCIRSYLPSALFASRWKKLIIALQPIIATQWKLAPSALELNIVHKFASLLFVVDDKYTKGLSLRGAKRRSNLTGWEAVVLECRRLPLRRSYRL